MRARRRQRYWSMSHGFGKGRKLADWGADDASDDERPPVDADEEAQVQAAITASLAEVDAKAGNAAGQCDGAALGRTGDGGDGVEEEDMAWEDAMPGGAAQEARCEETDVHEAVPCGKSEVDEEALRGGEAGGDVAAVARHAGDGPSLSVEVHHDAAAGDGRHAPGAAHLPTAVPADCTPSDNPVYGDTAAVERAAEPAHAASCRAGTSQVASPLQHVPSMRMEEAVKRESLDYGVNDAAMIDAAENAPLTDAAETDAPLTDVAETYAPLTDVAEADVPLTDAASADAPLTDNAPSTGAPSTSPAPEHIAATAPNNPEEAQRGQPAAQPATQPSFDYNAAMEALDTEQQQLRQEYQRQVRGDRDDRAIDHHKDCMPTVLHRHALQAAPTRPPAKCMATARSCCSCLGSRTSSRRRYMPMW